MKYTFCANKKASVYVSAGKPSSAPAISNPTIGILYWSLAIIISILIYCNKILMKQ